MTKPNHLSPTFSHAIIDPSLINVFITSEGKGSVPSMICPIPTSNSNICLGDFPDHSADNTWISSVVGYDALPEVPMFFPIQRTSTVVDDCSDPCTIANRITDCLQKLSITAEYNPNEASLLAEALDHTMFYVRLFKKLRMSSSSSKGVLVELQRVTGDSFNYVKYARAVLAAARGEVVEEREVLIQNYIPTIPMLSSSCCTDIECCEAVESDEEYILQVEELLKNYRLDAVLLGIESLLVLSDGEKSQVSSAVAEAVLRGDHGRSIIKNFINGCIHTSPRMSGSSPDESTASFVDYEFRHYENMHNTALAVLANALHTLSADVVAPDVICSLLQSEEWMGQSGIIDALLSELSHAEHQSHNAYHAARCLNALLGSSFEMRQLLMERGLSGVMQVSQRVGQRKHQLLAQECDAALAVMAGA